MSRVSTLPPLSLAYVAAVTPPDWEVKIIDENFDTFFFEEADLVGITAFTSNINRAYYIADLYKKKNIKVVIGGIHVSMSPEEGLRYADTVLVGEAENIWRTILSDFEKGCLKSKYIGPTVDLENTDVRARRDLLHPSYFWQSIQTSRGCPFNCHFCSVSKYLGKKYRKRKTSSVLEELEEIEGRYIAFVDDNLIGYDRESYSRASEIFQGMISRNLNKKWFMQTSINAADDERLVELASQSGCMFVFIGFETINKATLKEMKKGVNIKIGVENYKRVVDIFHKYGIGVMGAFIIGNDFESSDYYKKFADFIIKSGIDIVQISILTPLPGTILMNELKDSGRIIYDNFPEDWEKYRFSYMVHKPLGIKPEEVYDGSNLIKHKIYKFPTNHWRLLKSFVKLRKTSNFASVMKMNEAMRKAWKNSHYYKQG